MLTDFGSFILRENRFKLRVQRMHLRIHGPPLSMKAVKDRKAGGEVIGRLVILVSCSANLKKLEMRNGNVARRLRRVRIGLGELLAGGQRILSGPQGGFSPAVFYPVTCRSSMVKVEWAVSPNFAAQEDISAVV